jgi:hypothetical protein
VGEDQPSGPGPGGVLAGLLQRTRKGTEVIGISDSASLEAGAARVRAALSVA